MIFKFLSALMSVIGICLVFELTPDSITDGLLRVLKPKGTIAARSAALRGGSRPVMYSRLMRLKEALKATGKAESSKTEITDTGKGLKPDETEADKILQKAEQKKEVYNEPILQGGAQETKKYVRDADPETGISWDGESKIIYRTAEGLTTEKTYGGYYEIRPNEWVQLPYEIKEETVTDKCEHCGKVRGDGTNGTCIRYSLADGDMTCPNCGKAIPKHTCHTCGG